MRFRSFATGIGLAAVLGFVLYGGLILLPLFMQTLLGWTAATAGLWTSPRGIGTALCMPLVGYLLGRGWDGRWLLAFGFAMAGVTFFGFAHMTLQSGTWDIFWFQIIQGAALGLLFVPLTTLTMATIPPQETGYATSLFSVSRNHWGQHGNLLCDHLDHAALPVSSIHPGVSNYRYQPYEPGSDAADYRILPTKRHRSRNGQAQGRRPDLSDDATAGRTAELCGRVLHYGNLIPGCDSPCISDEATQRFDCAITEVFGLRPERDFHPTASAVTVIHEQAPIASLRANMLVCCDQLDITA
jgi:hypothetical protein